MRKSILFQNPPLLLAPNGTPNSLLAIIYRTIRFVLLSTTPLVAEFQLWKKAKLNNDLFRIFTKMAGVGRILAITFVSMIPAEFMRASPPSLAARTLEVTIPAISVLAFMVISKLTASFQPQNPSKV